MGATDSAFTASGIAQEAWIAPAIIAFRALAQVGVVAATGRAHGPVPRAMRIHNRHAGLSGPTPLHAWLRETILTANGDLGHDHAAAQHHLGAAPTADRPHLPTLNSNEEERGTHLFVEGNKQRTLLVARMLKSMVLKSLPHIFAHHATRAPRIFTSTRAELKDVEPSHQRRRSLQLRCSRQHRSRASEQHASSPRYLRVVRARHACHMKS